MGPAVQGQLFDILPGIFDFILFLRILKTGKFDSKTTLPIMERKFLTEPDIRTPAGCRRKLDMYEEPNFEAIWEKVKAQNESQG